MVVVRKWGEDYINKSLKQIDSNTWLTGGFVLYRSPFSSNTATWNDDGDNSSCTLKQALNPLPSATTPTESPYIKLVYDFVRDQQPSFKTPKVIHHIFDDDRSYLFIQRLPGRTLDAACYIHIWDPH